MMATCPKCGDTFDTDDTAPPETKKPQPFKKGGGNKSTNPNKAAPPKNWKAWNKDNGI